MVKRKSLQERLKEAVESNDTASQDIITREMVKEIMSPVEDIIAIRVILIMKEVFEQTRQIYQVAEQQQQPITKEDTMQASMLRLISDYKLKMLEHIANTKSKPGEDNFRVEIPSFSYARASGELLQLICFGNGYNHGWWHDLKTKEPVLAKRNIGELLCLIHSEISEAMEGARKDKQDDHLPHRKSLEVELADAVIRIFDLAGGFGLNLGEAIEEKLQYNAQRADHKLENRSQEGGKKF